MTYPAALEAVERQRRSPTGPTIEEYLNLDTPSAAPAAIRLTVPLASPRPLTRPKDSDERWSLSLRRTRDEDSGGEKVDRDQR